LTENERLQIQAGSRSSDAFVLRRCQILLFCSTVMTTFPFLCPFST
jgi:hypothetical protein